MICGKNPSSGTFRQLWLYGVILLSSQALMASATNCSAVKFKGPYISAEQERIGIVFQEVKQDAKGRPIFIYQLENGLREYLYCYDRPTFCFWAVGRMFDTGTQEIRLKYQLNESCADHPVDDERLWEFFTSAPNFYISYPDVTVICALAPDHGTKACDTVEIVGENIPFQAGRIGVSYQEEGHSQGEHDTIKGKPYFKSNNGDFMYSCTSSNNYSRWCVGPKIGGSNYQMYVGSSAPHPAEATGTWFIRFGASNFRPFLNLSVKCVGGTETALPKVAQSTSKATNTPVLPDGSTGSARNVSPPAESTTKDVGSSQTEDKQGDESDKPSSNTAFIIGVAAAVVVVVITLFFVFFIVMWKKLRKNNTQAGSSDPAYTPEATNSGGLSNAAHPIRNSPEHFTPSQYGEVPTDSEDPDYVYPSVAEITAETSESPYESPYEQLDNRK